MAIEPDLPTPIARRMALVVEYDGTAYMGFQLQSGQPTVQGAIESALQRFTGQETRIRGASRTDSGAHARGQVVDFLTESPHDPATFIRALNYYLPEDVRVLRAQEVAPEFHSRRSATSRVYRYQILNRPEPSALYRRYHHWVREGLDLDRMGQAARHLVGVHDFRPFALGHPPDRSAVRRVFRWEVDRDGETVAIHCEANGFLRQQIRRANAVLVEIGKGRWPEGSIKGILEGNLEQRGGWPTLPARGLCLIKVNYRDSWL